MKVVFYVDRLSIERLLSDPMLTWPTDVAPNKVAKVKARYTTITDEEEFSEFTLLGPDESVIATCKVDGY